MVNKFLYRMGGSQAVVLSEADLLREAGWDIVFFGVNHPNTVDGLEERRYFPDYMDLSNAAREYSSLHRTQFAARILYNFQAKHCFDAFLERYRPDVVHCHNIYNHLSPSILHAAKKRNIPVIMSLHDYHLVCPNYTLKLGLEKLCVDRLCFGGKYWHCIQNKCIKKAAFPSLIGAMRMLLHRRLNWFEKNVSSFIAPSDYLKTTIVEDGFAEDQIYRLYNTIPSEITQYIDSNPDIKTLSKATIISRMGRPFIYVGRLSPEKGPLTLAKAFADLPDQRLWMVGTGPQESEIQEFVNKRKAHNIKLFGYQSGEALWRLMKDAYVACMPSECYEVMPVSLLETFAFGLPAIGANVGGIPEVIHPGKTGWLFETGDVEALKQAVVTSVSIGSETYYKMSMNSKAWAQDNHSHDTHLSQLLHIYQMALQSSVN